jgi:putative oxidoreductase
MVYAFLAGRILFAFFHLSSAFNHFKSMNSYAQYAASKKVPVPKLAIIGSGILLLIGGLSILLGYQPCIGIAALGLFYLGVTPVMHNFWAAGPEHKQAELVNFMKNMALLGATLMFLAIPQPWPFSVGG